MTKDQTDDKKYISHTITFVTTKDVSADAIHEALCQAIHEGNVDLLDGVSHDIVDIREVK